MIQGVVNPTNALAFNTASGYGKLEVIARGSTIVNYDSWVVMTRNLARVQLCTRCLQDLVFEKLLSGHYLGTKV